MPKFLLPSNHSRALAWLCAAFVLSTLPACAVVDLAASVGSAAISVTSTVVSVTGKVVEKAIDVAVPDEPQP